MTPMPPPEERPTARQLAAQANGSDPWACPSCGCGDYRDWWVKETRMRDGAKVRQRFCRHCGHPMPTREVPCPDGFRVVVVPEEDVA